MDVEQEAPTCTGGSLPEFREHAPTPMEQDWMWRDVYRCPVCRTVKELWHWNGERFETDS